MSRPAACRKFALNIAKLAWTFNISQQSSSAIDDSIEIAYRESFLTAPIRFPIRLTPRSNHHEEVIGKSMKRPNQSSSDLRTETPFFFSDSHSSIIH